MKFRYDDVLVLADVVRKREDGGLEVYEVKSGNVLSDTYRKDAALQHYVVSHCREVRAFSIVYCAEDGGFVTEELTEELAACHDEIAANIMAMKEVALATAEPDIPMGTHCTEPYACPYQAHCQSGVRQLSLF